MPRARLRDLPRLVVAPDQRDAVWKANLQSITHQSSMCNADFEHEQQQEGLDAKVPAVDKVAQEQVVGVGNVAAHLENLNQVVVLPVHVAAHCVASVTQQGKLRGQPVIGAATSSIVGSERNRAVQSFTMRIATSGATRPARHEMAKRGETRHLPSLMKCVRSSS